MKIIDIPKDEKVENIKQNTPTGESQIIKLTIEGEDWIIFGFQSKLKTN